jgi:hypothetical protein
MSSFVQPIQPIIFISDEKDTIEESHILVIIRNMTGHSIPLAVDKTTTFGDVRHHVAIQMGLISKEIHLALDYNEMDDLTRIYTVKPLLETKGNVVDLLVEKQQKLSHMYFECRICHRHCNFVECIYSDEHDEHYTSHTNHVCCEQNE